MFHLCVMGVETTPWLSGYDGSDYSNKIMGEWFQLYKRDTKIYLCFVNHPVRPV